MTMPAGATSEEALVRQLRTSLAAIRGLKAEVERLRTERSEPIAIVGLGCRLPGGADSAAGLGRLLSDGADATREVPRDRWDADALFDADPATPGRTYARRGGFLADVAGFDADFFGLSPREAEAMDPQHRLALEVAWEALESACMDPRSLAETNAGVFLGLSSSDYSIPLLADRDGIDLYVGTGNAHGAAAGRISFLLGLRGPCMSVDTACSSSLTAVHLACQSLRVRECDLALAGGVNVMLASEIAMCFSKARMLSPDGRCKTFDAAADGYVRGEGCGIVVLRPLSDALRLGESVIAVIRGSAVNHDGRTSGLTVPSGPAQERVVREALARAGATVDEVGYVEAHGTGTALGDPIEMNALSRVFAGRTSEAPVRVGSIKTNIGHLEAAAGVAGLMKAALAVREGVIPASLHYERLNPDIEAGAETLRVAAERIPWPEGASRVAGVSAFGFGGSNAHVIVAAPPEAPPREAAETAGDRLLVLSARSEAALEEAACRMAGWLQERAPDAEKLRDVCFSLQVGRAHFEHRIAVRALDAASAAEALSAFASGRKAAALFGSGFARRPPPVLLDCGESGDAGFGGLAGLAAEPAYAALGEALAQCERELGVPAVASPVGAPPDRRARFAGAYGLSQLWRRWFAAPASAPADLASALAAYLDGRATLARALSFSDHGAAPPVGSVRLWLGPEAPAGALSGFDPNEPAGPFAAALVGLYVAGAQIDWKAVWSGGARRDVALPTYPFQRTRFMIGRAGASSPVLERAAPEIPAAAARAAQQSAPPLRAEIARLTQSERERCISRYLAAEVAQTLKYPPDKLPEVDAGFFELGLDSLMALDLTLSIEDVLGVALDETAVLDHPSIAAMARYIAGRLGAGREKPEVAAPVRREIAMPETGRTGAVAERLARVLRQSRAERSRALGSR